MIRNNQENFDLGYRQASHAKALPDTNIPLALSECGDAFRDINYPYANGYIAGLTAMFCGIHFQNVEN